MLDRLALIDALRPALAAYRPEQVESLADSILAALADQSAKGQLGIYTPLLEALIARQEPISVGDSMLSFGQGNDQRDATITVGDIASGNIMKNNVVTLTVPLNIALHSYTIAGSHTVGLPDTMTLVAWLDRLIARHNTHSTGDVISSAESQDVSRELTNTRAELLGQASTTGENTLRYLRRLIAGGILTWQAPPLNHPGDPALLIPSVVSAALWPLIQTPKLPADWEQALEQISGPSLVALVRDIRKTSSKSSADCLQRLAEVLPKALHISAIRNLLSDLRDEERGGAARVALSIARDGERPPAMSDISALLRWLLVGTTCGIIGDRADAIVLEAVTVHSCRKDLVYSAA